jgi:hypothetical protein
VEFYVADDAANVGWTTSRISSQLAFIYYAAMSRHQWTTQAITIQEPRLQNSITSNVASLVPDAGDVILFTCEVQHLLSQSTAPAYRVSCRAFRFVL